MPQDSFLSRKKFGLSHWFWIALATVVVLSFVPRGMRRAVESNTNKAEDWLPANYPESKDLVWFRDHFISAQFVLVSWDGCTLGEDERLRLLADKLSRVQDKEGRAWYPKILTGPEMIASLTRPPSNLKRSVAIERLEGALVGEPQRDEAGESLGDQTRTTCLLAYLSDHVTQSNLRMRAAVDRIEELAHSECGIPVESIHMGGPPVDNITIDKEGAKTLARLAFFSGIVGLSLAYWCLRSVKLTLAVFAVAGISAALSLAVVYWYGMLFEVGMFGQEEPRFGTVDAILMSMPAVVYVLGLSGAIHVVNYYRDERIEHGEQGAVERAVRIGLGPCLLAASTTAVGLGSLLSSDIIPIEKFGVFSAVGVLATVAVLFAVLPVFLHLYPPKLPGDEQRRVARDASLPGWAQAYVWLITERWKIVTTVCLAAMVFCALGLPKIRTSVQLLKLLDPGTDLIHDYAWLEEHLGNLVPMEIVVALTPDQLRSPDDHPEMAGDRYRMTMYERMQMIRRLQSRVEHLDEVSRAMTAATFSPDQATSPYTTSKALEENRDSLSDYLSREIAASNHGGESQTASLARKRAEPLATPNSDARELWRVSARVAALDDIDYGQFVGELRDAVEPVLDAYRTRDQLVALLHAEDKQLAAARLCIAFCGEDSAGAILFQLLRESGVRRAAGGRQGTVGGLDVRQLTDATAEKRASLKAFLSKVDRVVADSPESRKALRDLGVESDRILSMAPTLPDAKSPVLNPDATLAAVYTGIVPLVFKTQRELLKSLNESMTWATVLIAGVMVVLLRSLGGGLVSMIPNVFPIVIVFGTLGWLGVAVDIGIMMTASVALGVAVDDTIHFLTWFRRGVQQGLDRRSATRMAFERCGVAMTQTTLVAGFGLAVFATSTFTPTQQFGYLMITILSAALVGDLLMLPALLSSPLGWFFAPRAPAFPGAVPFRTSFLSTETNLDASRDAPQEPDSPTPILPPSQDHIAANNGTFDSAADPLSPSNSALQTRLKKHRRTTP